MVITKQLEIMNIPTFYYRVENINGQGDMITGKNPGFKSENIRKKFKGTFYKSEKLFAVTRALKEEDYKHLTKL